MVKIQQNANQQVSIMISNASNKYERESDKKRKAALATHKLAHQLQAQSGPYKRAKIQERIPYYD